MSLVDGEVLYWELREKIKSKIKELEAINQADDFKDHIQMLEELLEE